MGAKGNRGGTGMQKGGIKWKAGSYHQKNPKNYRLPGTLTETDTGIPVYSFINTLNKYFSLHTYSDSAVLTGCRNPLTNGIA